jgi:limonene-1,2-epoxide hydrolase
VPRLAALGAALAVAAAGTGASLAASTTASPAAVVRAWSKALNANDNAAAGRLFAIDALVVQGTLDARIPTTALAAEFNDSLPCSGRIVRLTVKGEQVTATFVLGHRPKHTCTTPGQKAAALFVVVGGKIVAWEQIPVPAPPPSKSAV